MERNNEIAAQFEAHRSHLSAVAYRMLGSRGEADDAVQEAWLHVERSGASGVQNVGGWLTTVVSRVCLDMLRARRSRREEGEDAIAVPPAANADGSSPDQATLLADSVGLALHVVLETLAPAERIAFVLHDMFDLAFDEIAAILGCSSAAARQLASRARRRVKGGSADSEVDITRHRHVVDAFLLAARSGDVSALLAVLDDDVTLRPDAAALEGTRLNKGKGAPKLDGDTRGPQAIAAAFAGRAKAAQPALIAGSLGAVWAPKGTPRVVFDFTIRAGKVVAIDVIGDPKEVAALDIVLLER